MSVLEQLREAVQRREAARRYDWTRQARPAQHLPDGDWRTWLILAGRGWGKSLTGAQTCRIWAKHFQFVNLIGATSDDARDIMIEGPSGILAICPDDERPAYFPAKRALEWPSGCKTLIFTADEPERLRGKQCQKLWMDELASWRYQQEAYDQAVLGLRIGPSPQCIITSTPKPSKLLKELLSNPATQVTRGTTYENRPNLAPAFFAQIINRFEGTRLGRQELNAELLEDNPGALWHLSQIDADRVEKAPSELERIVVAIDPATTNTKRSDETGIVVAARAKDGQFYVLEDLSGTFSPDQWAQRAVSAYYRHRADRIVGEQNQGGQMVEATIRHVDPNVSYKAVVASRGKIVRAEPISALYEQHRVRHIGSFPELEDQLCDFDPATSSFSPDRLDAVVWALTELSESGLVGGWLWELAAMHSDSKQARTTEPEAIERELGHAQKADAVTDKGKSYLDSFARAGLAPRAFGANIGSGYQSRTMEAAISENPPQPATMKACPNCGNKNLAGTREWQRCVCGWDSRASVSW